MHIIDFTPDHATPIAEYASRAAAAQPLADGHGEAHVYAVHIGPGGEIGPHPAGFGQLFLVVAGAGWVSGNDGGRHALGAGQGAFFARGELHAKGSETGLSAVMIQVAELAPANTRDTPVEA